MDLETDIITRVADRIVINAPGDFEVQHLIIGTKPERNHNDQYRYISSKAAISSQLEMGQLLYTRIR